MSREPCHKSILFFVLANCHTRSKRQLAQCEMSAYKHYIINWNNFELQSYILSRRKIKGGRSLFNYALATVPYLSEPFCLTFSWCPEYLNNIHCIVWMCFCMSVLHILFNLVTSKGTRWYCQDQEQKLQQQVKFKDCSMQFCRKIFMLRNKLVFYFRWKETLSPFRIHFAFLDSLFCHSNYLFNFATKL